MSEANKTPEQIARDRIDRMLTQAGWSVQDKNQIDFGRARGLPGRQAGEPASILLKRIRAEREKAAQDAPKKRRRRK